MIKRIELLTISLLFLSITSFSQDFKIKTFAGTTRYHGELSPYSFINATADAHFSLGASIGLQINDFYAINIKYLAAKISGNDAQSRNDISKARNLRFESPINEIGLISEFDLNNLFWGGLSKYGVHLIISTGVNLFHFNPRTDYAGNIYFLQEIGTEGQYLSNSSIEPYKLTQWNIPYGLTMEFTISKNLNMGIEVSSRYTFTDYLDDISGVYPDYELLLEQQGEIALALSNRMGELPGARNISEPGDLRGNPDNKDWYIVTGVNLVYYFGENPIKIKKQEEEEESQGDALIFPNN